MVIAVVLGVWSERSRGRIVGGGLGARSSWRAARSDVPPPPDPGELLARLLEANRALLEQERLRATSELDGKKALIDQQLASMTGELGKVSDLVRELEHDRHQAFGELTNELQRQHEGLNALSEHTQQLREVLASSQVRGQWGERMAEDVLRLAGFARRRQLPQAGDARRARAGPTTRS